jgi:RNA recognition motif-containing protein
MTFQPTRVVFVGCLKSKTTEDELFAACSKVGEVEDVIIKRDQDGKSRRFGLVTYKTPELALKAVDELNDTRQCGSIIHVELRKTKIPYYNNPVRDHYIGGPMVGPLYPHESLYEESSDSSSSSDKSSRRRKKDSGRKKKRRYRRRRRRSRKDKDYYSDSFDSGSKEKSSEKKKRRRRKRCKHYSDSSSSPSDE